MNTPLRATVRLQFHEGFQLDDATALVPYFADLGISHVYASPLLSARAGSMHGYDVVDPTRVDPRLGGEAALRRLVAALREHEMGLVLDIVSNHMAVGGADNPWWLDLLEWGRRSPYSEFFDIQWHSPDPLLSGQLLVPFLGSDYGAALQQGDVVLRFDPANGGFYVSHYQHRFPICPDDYPTLLPATLAHLGEAFAALAGHPDAHARAAQLREELAHAAHAPAAAEAILGHLQRFDSRTPEGFARLHRVLERQHYRLASWRTAADDINWRRFFDINELGGLRVERPAVFEATHAKLFQLLGEGLIDGLRIDHIDGLADPRGYCRKLRRRVDALVPGRHVPIYVEKILGDHEQLPADWCVDGTTGYEFMNQLSLLQHHPAGAEPLARLWSEHSGRAADFAEEVQLARQQVLNGSLGGDFESVAQALLQVARDDLMSRDLTLGAIRRALQALIVHYTVYRPYVSARGRSAQDQRFFQQALDGARQTLGEGDWPVLDYLEHWLGGQPWRERPAGRSRKLLRHACVRCAQLTAPTAAKAVEDTAFYRSAVLLSRNDVGFTSERFSASIEDFHQACQQRLHQFPDSLLTSATHDHKRGEDTRARLAVLSERSDWYAEQLAHWRTLAAPLRTELGPAPGDELMLYQTLLGSWPLQLDLADTRAVAAYRERLGQWQIKALREAKLHSSWNAPNTDYEQACQDFLDALLLSPQGAPLRQALARAVETIAPAGAVNGLAQVLLRNTCPGVPDLYQGNERWDFSLVDPDNRRPVDFALRRQASAQPADTTTLLRDWRDGGIKQALIAQSLGVRRHYSELFRRGDYHPLRVQGPRAEHIVSFARHWQGQWALVVVPRWVAGWLGDQPHIPPASWGETCIHLPPALRDSRWKGLWATRLTAQGELLPVSQVLTQMPVNLLIAV